MHADMGPNWKFHALVIFKALDLIESLQDSEHEGTYSRIEIALAIRESRESLAYLIEQLEPPPSKQELPISHKKRCANER